VLARAHAREEERRLLLPLEGDPASRRALSRKERRSTQRMSGALQSATARIVDRDEEDIGLEQRALERIAGRG
jgi:hypothetical protein